MEFKLKVRASDLLYTLHKENAMEINTLSLQTTLNYCGVVITWKIKSKRQSNVTVRSYNLRITIYLVYTDNNKLFNLKF